MIQTQQRAETLSTTFTTFTSTVFNLKESEEGRGDE
jgi:hypothetical protein